MNDNERERYAGLHTEPRRAEFAVSRALRACAVPQPAAPSSLSHSGGWAAVARAPVGSHVGVDIEWFRPRDPLKLARFAYHPDEIALLESLGESDCQRIFYALWTLKESMAKALGVPLLTATRQCTFLPGDANGEGEWQGCAPIEEPWTAWSFQPRQDMALAVVVIGSCSLATIATVEWPPLRRVSWACVARIRSDQQ